jgi:hypothetical protein
MSGEANSKLTDARVEAILNALRHGCTRRAAAAAGGVAHRTFYNWLEADDGTLLQAVERAEGEAEAAFTGIVAEAAARGDSWQAAAWWLERRRHEEYARRDKVDMTIDVKREAERIAAANGLDPAAVIAEAERVLAGQT